DLGLAHAGRPYHQDVLRRDLVAQRLRHLRATPAIAQGDGDRTLGAGLADDVLVEFRNDFGRSHLCHRRSAKRLFQRFDGVILVGVDADIAGNHQRLLDDIDGAQFGVLDQGARRRLGVGAAAADGDNAVFGFEHIAVAGDDQRMLAIGHGQHGFETAQHAVGAPVLGEFDGRAQQIALMFFQLGFETLEKRKRIGRAAGKTGEDPFLVQLAHLARAGLDDDIAERDLTIATEGDAVAAPHREDGGAVILLHGVSLFPEWRKYDRRAKDGFSDGGFLWWLFYQARSPTAAWPPAGWRRVCGYAGPVHAREPAYPAESSR